VLQHKVGALAPALGLAPERLWPLVGCQQPDCLTGAAAEAEHLLCGHRSCRACGGHCKWCVNALSTVLRANGATVRDTGHVVNWDLPEDADADADADAEAGPANAADDDGDDAEEALNTAGPRTEERGRLAIDDALDRCVSPPPDYCVSNLSPSLP
jgi:hypothetical protein